jgi:hypothetical protein
MRHMKQIPLKGVWSFVEQHLRDKPPVFWELVLPLERVAHSEEVGPVRRRSDSNTLEIAFPMETEEAVERDRGRLVQEFEGMVRRHAEAEDVRELHATEGPLPAGVGFELESRVPVTVVGDKGSMLEVIGPGGRATAFRGARGMTGADVTIRRRSGAGPGIWRRLHEIMRPLEQALDEDFTGTEEEPSVRAAFGYFELSKYEPQSLMRPVFMFAIEREQDPDGRWPGFQRIVVSAATTAREINDSDGLGMWADGMPCPSLFVLYRRRV